MYGKGPWFLKFRRPRMAQSPEVSTMRGKTRSRTWVRPARTRATVANTSSCHPITKRPFPTATGPFGPIRIVALPFFARICNRAAMPTSRRQLRMESASSSTHCLLPTSRPSSSMPMIRSSIQPSPTMRHISTHLTASCRPNLG
ncbi:hypothetical protein D3C86_1563600 [compost metagenome]